MAALAAAALGDQDSRGDQTGGVKLEKLHVLQRQTGPVGHGQSVAGDGVRIGGEAVQSTGAARGDEQSLALERDEVSAGSVNTGQPGKTPILQHQVGDEQLVVAGEVVVLEQRVVEGLHLEEAGLVGGQGGAWVGVTAKGPLVDAAVGISGPRDPPMIQQQNLLRRGMDKTVDDILVGQEVGSLYRVPGMELERIAFVGAQHGRGAAFGADRMGTHELDLGDDTYVGPALGAARDLHRSPQPGQSGPENQHIVIQVFGHGFPPRHLEPKRDGWVIHGPRSTLDGAVGLCTTPRGGLRNYSRG